jgi:hypothetical protein
MPILYLPPAALQKQAKPKPANRIAPNSWFHDQVLDRIHITGERTFGYHFVDIQGDSDSFNTLNYYGQGASKIMDVGQAQVNGRKVAGVLDFDFQLENNRFGDPQGQRTTLSYERKGWSAKVGDIQGSLLNTNMFATFNKTLRGGMVGYQSGRFQVRALRSDVRGSARTVTLQGNGSAGPYYLNANQLVQDSEQVRVDGTLLKIGVDYTFDYQVGAVTFINRSIPQTSSITVSFEELGVNSGFGSVQGVGASYDLGMMGRFGTTMLQQTSPGAHGLNTREDLFQGFGAPETPYTLTFQPEPGAPIVMKLDGLVQTQGIDYRFDTGNPSIFYFLRFVPSTSTIDVVYTPIPTATVDGDRKVIGYDYQLPFKGGKVGFSQANGSLSNTPTPMSGTARGATLDYRFKTWAFNASVRDVPATFVGVQTQGFNRNEKSDSISLTDKLKAITFGFSHENSAVSASSLNTDGSTTFEYGRTTSTTGYAQGSALHGIGWNLTQSHTTSSESAGDDKLDTTNLTLKKEFGKLSLGATAQRLTGIGLVTTDTGSTTSTIKTQSAGLSSAYEVGNGWSVNGHYNFTDTSSEGINGHGRDATLNLGYHPRKGNFGVDLGYIDSRSGSIAALSQFTNGSGFGYDGSSFSSPTTAGTSIANGATDLRSITLATNVRLSSALRMDGHLNDSTTTGSISSNTRSTTYGTGVQWDFAKTHSLNLTLDQNQTSYIGTDTAGTSTSLNGYLVGAFNSKWNYRFGTGLLLAGGGPYAQNHTELDASLNHRLSDRDLVSFNFQSGFSTGYQPQADNSYGVYYTRRLFQNIALVTSYTVRNLSYSDLTDSGIGYRSHGFDIQLTFDFNR